MNRGFEADMDRLLRDRLRQLIADTSHICRIGGMSHDMIAATLLCALMVELAAAITVALLVSIYALLISEKAAP